MLIKYIKILFVKLLVHFLALVIISSNCLASYKPGKNIVPDNSILGNKVYIEQSANNKVPVVNINNPNDSGVLHNHFSEFNVGANGAIINNSSINSVSKIGGTVIGNANLNRSADTIINEVTGTNRSHINGVQEILGKSANYILANPNGISINGGEFINNQGVIFTTGKTQLDSLGQLEKLLVERGDIIIEGKTIDVSNLDYFDLISRTLSINTVIHAEKNNKTEKSRDVEANISTGTGEYIVKDKTLKSKNAKSEPVEFSIDSSQFGGLHAGKIKIIGSEKGVGVNLPKLHATNGNVIITVDGKIVHKEIDSVKAINVESRNNKIVVESGAKVTL